MSFDALAYPKEPKSQAKLIIEYPLSLLSIFYLTILNFQLKI